MVLLKALLPNPEGRDSGREWIQLVNQSPEAFNLESWHIEDKSGARFELVTVGELGPGEVVELRHAVTGIDLNNNGDTLYLYRGGELADQLTYTSAAEGEIIFSERLVAEQSGGNGLASLANMEALSPAPSGDGLSAPVLTGLALAVGLTGLFVYLAKMLLSEDDD